MGSRGAGISRIGTIVFQQVESGLLIERVEFAKVVLSPGAAQAGCVAKLGAAGFARGLVDNIVLGADSSTGQQGVATEFDALAVGIVGQCLPLGECVGILVFEVEAAAEGKDDHLKTNLGALIDCQAHGVRVCPTHMHHQRVFRDPGRDGAIHASYGQALAFSLRTVKHQLEGTKGFKSCPGGDVHVGTDRGTRLQ